MRLIHFTSAVFLLALMGCRPAPPIILSSQETVPTQGTVTVDATGTVEMTPDFASLEVSFSRTRPTLKEARNVLHEAIVQLSKAAEVLGVTPEDITTSSVGIEPVYNEESDEEEITGYRAYKSTRIVLRKLSRLDALAQGVLDVSGEMGNISDITLGVSDETAFEEEARGKAMAHANEKAEQLARNASARLGRPASLTERVATPTGSVSKEVLFAHIRQGSRAPVQQKLKASVSVSVTYNLM